VLQTVARSAQVFTPRTTTLRLLLSFELAREGGLHMAADRPVVFISYSHDSEDHSARVRGLEASLARDGCDCRLDVHKDTDEDWPLWMTRQLEEADLVLCVVTETYSRRFSDKEQPDAGLGAGWEAGLIRRLLYGKKLRNSRIFPVLLDRRDSSRIPLELQGYDFYVLDDQSGYEALLRKVHGRAAHVKPAPGTVPDLKAETAAPLFPRPGADAANDSDPDPVEPIEPEPLTGKQQRELLVSAAVASLATSSDSLRALANRLKVSVHPDDRKCARTIVDRLLEEKSPPKILTPMIKAINDLNREQASSGVGVIEDVACCVIPAALTDSHVQQMTIVADLKSGKYEFQARTRMFVELAMARISARRAKFRDLSGPKDIPVGRFCLAAPPEAGMDKTHDRFIQDFVDGLSGMIGAELLDGDEAETVRAINAELETQLEIDGWQYYYVFEYPQHESERRRRHELAARLDAMFPLIAFIGLNRAEPSEEEFATVSRMMRLLCHAAGIEYEPHGPN
jgi:TIR domain-containing protein